MARGRLLAPALSTSHKFAALYAVAGDLAEFCQVLFTLLVAHADECGRQHGDPFTVKHRVLPSAPRSVEEVDQALDALQRVGLVQRYTADERSLLAIPKFQEHQALRHPPQSTLPPPPGQPLDPLRPRMGDPGPIPDPSCPGMYHHGSMRPAVPSKRREEKSREEKIRDRAHPRAGLLTSVDYLEACPHDPPCETPHLCGTRRQLAAAVRDGQLTPEEAARLEQLWLIDRQMLRASLPTTARRRTKEARHAG